MDERDRGLECGPVVGYDLPTTPTPIQKIGTKTLTTSDHVLHNSSGVEVDGGRNPLQLVWSTDGLGPVFDGGLTEPPVEILRLLGRRWRPSSSSFHRLNRNSVRERVYWVSGLVWTGVRKKSKESVPSETLRRSLRLKSTRIRFSLQTFPPWSMDRSSLKR